MHGLRLSPPHRLLRSWTLNSSTLLGRHRLGLPPQHNLPATCRCGAVLRDDPAHFHSSSRLMPRAITARHDGIVQLVAAIFRRAGALVNIEVKCDGETRVRPDIEIILPDHSILVDVAVVHPSAPSRRNWLSPPRVILRMSRRPNTHQLPLSAVLGSWPLLLNLMVLLESKPWNY